MSLRKYISILLLPLLAGVVTVGGVFTYFTWSHQLRRSTEQTLLASVTSAATAQSSLSASEDAGLGVGVRLFRVTNIEDGWQIYTLFGAEPSIEEVDQLGQTLSGSADVQWNSDRGWVTASAPVSGESSQWMLAQSPIAVVHSRQNGAIGAIVFVGSLLLGLLTLASWYVFRRITQPIHQLKISAMALAAGDYEHHVSVEGPTELSALGNTLNVLRTCLQDQLQGIQEQSAARDLVYGEYECCQLLQDRMVDAPIASHTGDSFRLKGLRLRSGTYVKGLLLDIIDDSACKELHIYEATEFGVKGIYDLLRADLEQQRCPHVHVRIDGNYGADIESDGLPPPLVWSSGSKCFLEAHQSHYATQPGDYIILANSAFAELLAESGNLHRWFEKVLRNFAESGLDSVSSMLNHELVFLANRKHLECDVQLVCIRLHKESTPQIL